MKIPVIHTYRCTKIICIMSRKGKSCGRSCKIPFHANSSITRQESFIRNQRVVDYASSLWCDGANADYTNRHQSRKNLTAEDISENSSRLFDSPRGIQPENNCLLTQAVTYMKKIFRRFSTEDLKLKRVNSLD